MFQHHTKLCSTCNTLLVSSLNFSPICRWKDFSCCWMFLCHDSPGLNFPCTSFITCNHAAHVAEIFHILLLFLIYHELYWGRLSWDSHYFDIFPHSLSSSTTLPFPAPILFRQTRSHLDVSRCELLVSLRRSI